MKYNFVKLLEQYEDCKLTKRKFSAMLDVAHVIPVLGVIKPVAVQQEGTQPMFSPELTLRGIAKQEKYVTINKDVYTCEEVSAAVKLMHQCPRGSLIKGMVKDPYYASLTPLALLAAREFHKVPYSAWDKSDPYIKVLLGSFLECLVDFATTKEEVEVELSDKLNAYRELALTSKAGKTANQIASLSSNKMNCQITVGDAPVPKQIMYMLLQTWLANEVNRTPSMILDPWDWDNMPEAYDAPSCVMPATAGYSYDF